MLPELEARELDRFLAERADAVVLDVRESHEALLEFLPAGALSVHIPASQLEARMHELDSAKTYVPACRVGSKSMWAALRLRDAGFKSVYHLREGLLAYTLSHYGEIG
jgi:adenylyltransferase/sulfurtransferase